MRNRVVITGIGVIRPKFNNTKEFERVLLEGKSCITFSPELAALNFGCHLGGTAIVKQEFKDRFLKRFKLKYLHSSPGILFGLIAAVEAWEDAGLEITDQNHKAAEWDKGCIFGSNSNGLPTITSGTPLIDQGRVKFIGVRSAQLGMNSGVSAHLGGILGLGNLVTTNASACNTGSEAVVSCFERVASGKAKIMLAGSSEGNGPHVWGPFDALRVLTRESNDVPELASCPMSNRARGFVPSSGSGALVIESLESAQERGAKIYAEIIGGCNNSGGHRNDGSMYLANIDGVSRCFEAALRDADIQATDIDLISGHLTSTEFGDRREIKSYVNTLNLKGLDLPYINSVKSMIGHSLSAAGSIEAVACVLQLKRQFIHASLNAFPLDEEVGRYVDQNKVPQKALFSDALNIIAKVSLGFGDVNSCYILKKWT